jgi:hypothetical protein
MMMLATQPIKAPAMIHIMKLIIFFSWVNGSDTRVRHVPMVYKDYESIIQQTLPSHIHRLGRIA